MQKVKMKVLLLRLFLIIRIHFYLYFYTKCKNIVSFAHVFLKTKYFHLF